MLTDEITAVEEALEIIRESNEEPEDRNLELLVNLINEKHLHRVMEVFQRLAQSN